MINYVVGNILDSPAQALVNTVNTVGIMGKGIALQFKKSFPNNFKAYKDACDRKLIAIGKLFVTKDQNIDLGEKIVVNFPTKKDWRKPSEYEFIERGLQDLVNIIEKHEIKSIAIPPLGAGNGGLDWEKVKKLIETELGALDIEITVYEPTRQIIEHLKKERIKLTDARALLLYTLYDLVKNGEFVSEFSSEKVCYFLQRFGAKKYFKLKFEPNFYGPYSGKAKYVLNALNGSYVMGYSDMNKRPFEPMTLVADGYKEVQQYVESNPELHNIAKKTIGFLDGFYSDFALELLSTIDYLSVKHETFDKEIIVQKLEEWSDRKRSLFSNPKYVYISVEHLKTAGFVEH